MYIICKISCPTFCIPQNLGFKIGPRINAAGRLGSSKLGVDLLCAEDDLKAELLAKKLDDFLYKDNTFLQS